MRTATQRGFRLLGTILTLTAPVFATVTIKSITPSVASPQVIGTSITWTVTATDTNPGPLTFQFNVGQTGKTLSMVKDYNLGTLSGSTWTAQPFVWVPTGPEATYHIEVVIKDFSSGETSSKIVSYSVTPLVTGSTPVAAATGNPLVALFSAPACASGSTMRAFFQRQSGTGSGSTTPFVKCDGVHTMTFEIAGMYASSHYAIHAQTNTGGKITNGPSVAFTTGPLPSNISFPALNVIVPTNSNTDTAEPFVLWGINTLNPSTLYHDEATDLSGHVMWYYGAPGQFDLLTRPLANGGMLIIQNGASWNNESQIGQLLHQIDLAGNLVKETNTGVIQTELLALGATDGGPCTTIPQPAPVGSACLGGFHHELTTFPNGDVAALASVEKIFPPGTQGDTSGLPVDVIGDMIVVMNSNWQVIWYWDSFQFLDVNRPAVLGETCTDGASGCPPTFLLGHGIAPLAKDWLHGNSLYYWSQNGDIIFSMKHQDWVDKIDYNNGTGTGDVLWTMGVDGTLSFNNINDDPWPWFSHQHDVTIATNGTGPFLLFDNGDTRISPPPLGLGTACGPNDCYSRGMALTVDENTMTVTPVLSLSLGNYSSADGSAQLLSNGNYFFASPLVVSLSGESNYAIEVQGNTQVLSLQGPQGYRSWQLVSLYSTN